MRLLHKSLIIAFALISLVGLLIFYPTPHTIFFAMSAVSVFALLQTYFVLKDKIQSNNQELIT